MMKLTGITPSSNPQPAHFGALKAQGFTRLRAINIDSDTILPITQWSGQLEGPLTYCKMYGFLPHLILGQSAPKGLPAFENFPADFPETDYRAYIAALLQHVVDAGHTNFSVEVGNEMWGGNCWLVPSATEMSAEIMSAYWKLYWIIQGEVSACLVKNPTARILCGMNLPHLWLPQMIQSTKGLKRDFVGLHWYGLGARFDDVRVWIEQGRAQDASCQIWVTESGYDPYLSAADPLGRNGQRAAYWWGQLFLEFAKDLVDEVFALQAVSDGCGYWMSDGVTLSPYGRALMP